MQKKRKKQQIGTKKSKTKAKHKHQKKNLIPIH